MTGYTVHTGSTEKFSSGWDQIFSAGETKKSKKKVSSAKKPTAAKSKVEASKKSVGKVKRGK